MNAQTVGWLVFLALIKNFSCIPNPFRIPDTTLTAKEGSCIDIKCSVTVSTSDVGGYWFWIKDPAYNEEEKDFAGTIIYSSNTSRRADSAGYSDRVKYIGSPSSSWKDASVRKPLQCSILICDLNRTDSGSYSFRFVGKNSRQTWITAAAALTVTKNPCPVTFVKPPAVKEDEMITLTCSTSCSSNLQIGGLTQLSPMQLSRLQQRHGKHKRVSFTVSWEDDGKEFSCFQDPGEKYLVRNISITVEYAPKETVATISPQIIKEGQSVTLTCSAKGRPDPTFAWFQNNTEQFSGAEWVIPSIEDSRSGEYHCEAKNKDGQTQSKPVRINVTYKPKVEVVASPSSEVKQGDEVTFTCSIMRSNPPPSVYHWFINGTSIHVNTQTHVKIIEPEDRGFYTCEASNRVGTGTSEPHHIGVKYGPRRTHISIINRDTKVKVGYSLTLDCNTDANPLPDRFAWHRYNKYKQADSSQWSTITTRGSLHLTRVQRTDEACYTCNATNSISTGEHSEPLCIDVLYPPTKPVLSMDTEVREGQLVTISCTVESFPPSQLTLTGPSKHFTQPGRLNTLKHKFIATSTDTGFYTCDATNSEGSNRSLERRLVVRYPPKDVTVTAEPDLVVNENTLLTLTCSAHSHPEVTSVTWRKVIDGKDEIIRKPQTFSIKSVSPSDSGLYSCEATNKVGSGRSQRAEVKVKYAPKHTNITKAAEHQRPDGRSSVMLSCSSHSYPPVTQYSWHKKKGGNQESDVKVSGHQNYTVFSDNPGVYYCVAENEINQRSSEPIALFVNSVMKTLIYFFIFLFIFIILLIFFIYRHKRNKSTHRGTSNTPPCFGFLGWWNSTSRGNLMNEPVVAEPFRSRDDLLSDQPSRPRGQRRRPDSTPASNINSVYCTVNLPARKPAPSAQTPSRQRGGHAGDESLNYASLHFGNEQKNEQAADVVYSVVSKQKPPLKNEQRRLDDYENVSVAKPPNNELSYDTDTSEEEEDDDVELSYSQVSFKAKPGRQRGARRDSSSSDEEETQYSEVKI